MDRAQLADFLRTRRETLQPEDVGLPRGPRRRTGGLRREEVAVLCGMSTDYYGRLEQRRGPQPSTQMLAAMARGLRLTLAERDHLYRLAGHDAPAREALHDHVSPGLMRVLDRLADTPAQVMNGVGETLVQTPPAAALFGDETVRTGLTRVMVYRWFTEPDCRRVYPEDDHPLHGRAFVADLRAAYARPHTRARAQMIVDALLERSPEFAAIWTDHEVGIAHGPEKRLWHPELGVMTLQCQLLHDLDQAQVLLVLTATPGTESYEKLALLAVLGRQRMSG
jgi:transcriptional regulator with XRE-family HTH domain